MVNNSAPLSPPRPVRLLATAALRVCGAGQPPALAWDRISWVRKPPPENPEPRANKQARVRVPTCCRGVKRTVGRWLVSDVVSLWSVTFFGALWVTAAVGASTKPKIATFFINNDADEELTQWPHYRIYTV